MKAIITDLDGTILPCGGIISPQTIASLKNLGSHQITRIIATGRTLFAARKFLPDDFPIDYLIFSSGAGIMRWHDKKIIKAHHLTLTEARSITDYLWDYNINFMIQREIPDNHFFYYTDIYPCHSDYKRRLEKFDGFGTLIHDSSELQNNTTQFIMILDARQLKLIEQIRADLSGYSVIRSTSPLDNRAVWLEIFPHDINKGSSCQFLLDTLGIDNRDCVGIGNDYNDVDFLDICKDGYLVANAPLRLKPHYKTVSADIKEGFSEFASTILAKLL